MCPSQLHGEGQERVLNDDQVAILRALRSKSAGARTLAGKLSGPNRQMRTTKALAEFAAKRWVSYTDGAVNRSYHLTPQGKIALRMRCPPPVADSEVRLTLNKPDPGHRRPGHGCGFRQCRVSGLKARAPQGRCRSGSRKRCLVVGEPGPAVHP